MAEVFQFKSSASLERLTGRKAHTLKGLLDMIKTCPDASIFYHTFSAYMKMHEVQAPYNSEFAMWVYGNLNERALAEKLMAVDFAEYNSIQRLRGRLIDIISGYGKDKPVAFQKKAEDPFYLCSVFRVVYLTDRFVYDLESFYGVLKNISIYSLYYHYIESRLETQLESDDFSIWIENELGIPELAWEIKNIDFYNYDLEGLRVRILELIELHLEK